MRNIIVSALVIVALLVLAFDTYVAIDSRIVGDPELPRSKGGA
jgi:hypothetical protein